jgi:hypothetical protein
MRFSTFVIAAAQTAAVFAAVVPEVKRADAAIDGMCFDHISHIRNTSSYFT